MSVIKLSAYTHVDSTYPSGDTPLNQTVERLMRALEESVHQVPGGHSLRIEDPVEDIYGGGGKQTAEEMALINAKLWLSMRRLRERAFGSDLFSDPAWSIMIELYIALAENVLVSVGNACIASALPVTSALRLCQQLQERKLVIRERDPNDRRRILLRLSDTAYHALTQILSGAKSDSIK